MSDVTRILARIESGDPQAAEQLLPLVYDELRKLAAARMAKERPDHTLQATALVHDAYIRLVDVAKVQHWNSRGHFFGAAAEAMRRILVEEARRKMRLKRGGDVRHIELAEMELATNESPLRLVEINDAISELEKEDPQAAALVKLRYFAGFSLEEAADCLGASRSTAYAHWSYAKAWLRRQLESSDASASE